MIPGPHDRAADLMIPHGIKGLLRFRRDLMHTAFEVIFGPGPDPAVAEQAAHEAFGTAEKLESEFSRFLPNSDVSRVNRLEAGASVRVLPDTFECVSRGLEIQAMTGGAFDVTAGTGWNESEPPRSGNRGNEEAGKRRDPADRPRLILDRETFEVRVTGRVTLDLGGIGKGYAVDRMVDVLKEWDIPAALAHGGQSAVAAFGRPEGFSGWPVTSRRPSVRPDSGPGQEDAARLIARFELNGRAMGASGIEKGPHIIDPATGLPIRGRVAAWAFADDAATADGLSTAFMVMDSDSVRDLCDRHSSVSAVLIGEEGIVQRFGAEQCA